MVYFQLLKYCCISLIRKNSDLNERKLQKGYDIKWVSKEWSSTKCATENEFQKIFLVILIKLHIFRYQICVQYFIKPPLKCILNVQYKYDVFIAEKSSKHIVQSHHKRIRFQVIYTLLKFSPCNPSSCLVVTR